MALKLATWFTLVAFVLFDCSCVVHRTRMGRPEEIMAAGGGGGEVLAVLTTAGETIEFGKEHPGWIRGDAVEGFQRHIVDVTIAKARIVRTAGNRWERVVSLRTLDGKPYDVTLIRASAGDSLSFKGTTRDFVSVPLATVDVLTVRRVDAGGTFLATVGGLALVAGIGVAIIAATKESCPFVYSFDGEQYQFDAEPYGGATCEGLKRTEWCALEHATEIDGTYRLRLTNEVDETQYTDELKLVVVDHPEGIAVGPDVEGTFVAFPGVIPPISACDGTGRDLMRHVATNDWIFWESKVALGAGDSTRPLREELTFQFPKPRGARTAKVLFNGCNTLWGSQMVKRLLELRGDQVTSWYRQINAHGPLHAALGQWGLREECFRLHARVQTATGWESRALFLGGGPFVSEDKAYALNISDVPGDTLTLRLTPPSLFWMINFIGVDYSETQTPIRVTEVTAKEAVEHTGLDVSAALAATDGRYLCMPQIGDYADIVFDAPDRAEGQARSVFVKASGYYDIHLNAQGPPNLELLTRVATEPGYVARYALDQYLEWRAQMLASR